MSGCAVVIVVIVVVLHVVVAAGSGVCVCNFWSLVYYGGRCSFISQHHVMRRCSRVCFTANLTSKHSTLCHCSHALQREVIIMKPCKHCCSALQSQKSDPGNTRCAESFSSQAFNTLRHQRSPVCFLGGMERQEPPGLILLLTRAIKDHEAVQQRADAPCDITSQLTKHCWSHGEPAQLAS